MASLNLKKNMDETKVEIPVSLTSPKKLSWSWKLIAIGSALLILAVGILLGCEIYSRIGFSRPSEKDSFINRAAHETQEYPGNQTRRIEQLETKMKEDQLQLKQLIRMVKETFKKKINNHTEQVIELHEKNAANHTQMRQLFEENKVAMVEMITNLTEQVMELQENNAAKHAQMKQRIAENKITTVEMITNHTKQVMELLEKNAANHTQLKQLVEENKVAMIEMITNHTEQVIELQEKSADEQAQMKQRMEENKVATDVALNGQRRRLGQLEEKDGEKNAQLDQLKKTNKAHEGKMKNLEISLKDTETRLTNKIASGNTANNAKSGAVTLKMCDLKFLVMISCCFICLFNVML